MTASETTQPDSPDLDATTDSERRAGWRTYIVVSLLLCMYFFQLGALGPYKEQMAASLDVPLTDVVFSVTIGYVLCALLFIPSALLLERLGVRRLAWPCSLLIGGGVGLMSISQSIVGIYTGVVLVTLAVCILTPMTGIVARTRIDERIFIMVSTIMLVTIRLFEVLSLTLAGFLLDIVHWRVFYACMAVLFIPLTIIAWRTVTDEPHRDQAATGGSFSDLPGLLRNRVVLLSGIALAFALAPTTAFGFIWNINLQAAFGWEEPMKSVLTATFVIGVISGGLLAGVVAHWVGAYVTTLSGLALGTVLFAVLLFQPTDSKSTVAAMPLMFFCGLGLGTTALIAPYAAKCLAPHYAGLVFSITGTIKSLFSGVLVGVPLWFLPTGNTWTLEQEQSALLPYLVVLAIAVVVFLFTRARSYEERTTLQAAA
ncbi:MAG: MFS transporter [Phycisphaerales bacterium]|nr:MFS transporter [Phycisphaerales bacterium]